MSAITCHAEPDEAPFEEELGVAESAITVAQAIDSSCSTLTVKGLGQQIIDQANCIAPGAYSEVPDLGNVSLGDSIPYLQEPARDAFVDALNDNPGMNITINSMLRTVAQQLLLYRWYLNGECGISLAASPGASNHETGLAFDTSQYNAWRPTLEAHGFVWLGGNDPVHFDYAGPGVVDHGGVDVLAFQQLWNDNNPDDLIDEDGAYGPQTEARLLASPAEGFPGTVVCEVDEPRPDVALAVGFESDVDTFVDGPSAGIVDLFEREPTSWWIVVDNGGEGVATDVVLAIDLEEASFDVDDFVIERSASADGPFEADPATTSDQNPAHGVSLVGRFDLHLGAIEPGERKRVALEVDPLLYSVDTDAAPTLRTWVSKVDDLYAQDAFGGDVINVDDSQSFGGGRLELAQQADIYSRTHWEWESPRLEGVSGSGALSFSSSSTTLDLTSDEAGAAIMMPPTNLSTPVSATVQVRASRSGGSGRALLLVARDASELEGAEAFELDLAADGAQHELTVDIGQGRIRRIAFIPFEDSPGVSSVDFLRIDGVVPIDDEGTSGSSGDADGDADGDSNGCTCIAARGERSGGAAGLLAVMSILGLGLLRRRRRPAS